MSCDATQELRAYCTAALACADVMNANGGHVRREISAFELDDERVREVEEVCGCLCETRWDLATEVGELEELDAPADSGAVRMRVERIHRWLGDDLPRLHELVQDLEAASDERELTGFAFVLVAESATRILQSFLEASEALERYRAAAGQGVDA